MPRQYRAKRGPQRKRVDRIGLRKEKGRPSRYNQELHDKLVFELGMCEYNNKEIAKRIGLDEWTLYDWIKKYPTFSQSIKNGRNILKDRALVTMKKRLEGYVSTEITEKDDPKHDDIIRTVVKKEHPPDVKAAEIVLNRWDRSQAKGESPEALIEALDALRASLVAKRDAKEQDDKS